MNTPEPSALQVVAGAALLVALFVVREVASGALRRRGIPHTIPQASRPADAAGAHARPPGRVRV